MANNSRTIHIVPGDAMNASVIIGNGILNLAEVTINAEGVTIRKVPPTIFLAQIDVSDESPLNVVKI